ncbi:MAG TPA: PilX N-terminal domain-containing pilus assembly protein [Terriglobales bacterium]|jgi:type II secretory pathway pseudopilin PulG
MNSNKNRQRGFTLIACLLLLLLLTGLSIALMSSVHTETTVSLGDSQNGVAYHAAEGAIEKMTADLGDTFKTLQSPPASTICNLSADLPTNTPSITYTTYSLTPVTGCAGNLTGSFGEISSGPNQGLYAQIIPINLTAAAQTTQGQQVSMSRQVEVALIPVFQFGVFSDSDLSFFAGPNLQFQGRVHTNGDLYLAAGDGGTTTFHDKITAYGNVIRDQMPNTLDDKSFGHNGNVAILTKSNGCDTNSPSASAPCRYLNFGEGSTIKGSDPVQSNQNSSVWPTNISLTAYATNIIDGNYGNKFGTGAVALSLPFVSGTATTGVPGNGPWSYEIIRRPPVGVADAASISQSRLYNEANIRILLSDDPADLPGGAGDAQNIRLANVGVFVNGVATSGIPANETTYFATADTSMPDYSQSTTSTTVPADWLYAPVAPQVAANATLVPGGAPIIVGNAAGTTAAPGNATLCNQSGGTFTVLVTTAATWTCPTVFPFFTASAVPASTWNLIDGYLRVEYVDAGGATHAVTSEWLGLGFARFTKPPTAIGGNVINPQAILLFQEPADRNADGVIETGAAGAISAGTSCTGSGASKKCTYTVTQAKPSEVLLDAGTGSAWYGKTTGAVSPTLKNWYPINLYDAREGEIRDVQQANASCTPMGIMNAVELDIGNLQQWLKGNIGASGASVDTKTFNGYILYFSDRRGMLPNPNGNSPVSPVNSKTGDSGFEDSINSAVQIGTPDGTLEGLPTGKLLSPEDVNENSVLDNFGGGNLGLGFGYLGAAYTVANSVNAKIAANNDPWLTVAGRIQPNASNATSGYTSSCSIGQKNWVSGARHVLRLVDGTLGNLPTPGFTIASENPVYVLGDYNSSAADASWGGGADPAHSAAAIIADAVTMLSNNWSDLVDFQNPSQSGKRAGANTYYRMAIAAGKNINFPIPGYAKPAAGSSNDFGTDGGTHNFLRFLESWGSTINYKGSLVSMFYSTYATGTFKDGTVYGAPTRNYSFDPLFAQPSNLPPGTPLFRDVDNLSYRQSFTPQ